VGYEQAAIVADDEVLGSAGIDPHGVVVRVRVAGDAAERGAAVVETDRLTPRW
jgi:hypothetical protein